jgi:hypothetical protein
VRIEAERAVVWRQGHPQDVENLSPSEAESRGTWAFVLEKIDEGTTRLILRQRSGHKPRMRDIIFHYLFMERQLFIMERRLLNGIKERAERAQAAARTAQPSLRRTPMLEQITRVMNPLPGPGGATWPFILGFKR